MGRAIVQFLEYSILKKIDSMKFKEQWLTIQDQLYKPKVSGHNQNHLIHGHDFWLRSKWYECYQ